MFLAINSLIHKSKSLMLRPNEQTGLIIISKIVAVRSIILVTNSFFHKSKSLIVRPNEQTGNKLGKFQRPQFALVLPLFIQTSNLHSIPVSLLLNGPGLLSFF